MIQFKELCRSMFLIFLTGTLLIGGACKQQSTVQSEHDHAHDVEPIQYTAYSNDFEVFAEANPFIKGKSTNILAHFTHLENFEPLESKKIVISLIVGNKGIRQTFETHIRKGIYIFNLQPTTIGKGELHFDIYKSDSVYRVVIPGIQVYDNDHDAANSIKETEHSAPTIIFTKEQSWKIGLRTAIVEKKAFGQVIHSAGVITNSPQKKQIVTARNKGFVTLIGNLTLGSKVKKGDILFHISGNKLAEDNSSVRFLEAKNNYETAKARLDRMQTLSEHQIVSERDVLDAQREFKNAKAIYENLDKNFTPEGMQVMAPMNGYLSQLMVSNGEFVESGASIAETCNNRKLFLNADVSTEDAKVMPLIKTVRIKRDNTLFSQSIPFKLVSVGQSTNADNYLVPVTIELEETINLIPGEIVEITFQTRGESTSFFVPNKALIEEQGNFFVMVQVTPEQFEKRRIKTGESNGTETVVLSGLSAGERIISKGAIMVKLSQASGTLDPHAGHVH